MRLKQRVYTAVRAQFGRPTGFWGQAAGLLMAHRSSNRRRNAWAVSLLDVRARHRVLEIGFGPGLAILELSRIAHRGYVCGIDHSEVMLRQASRRNADGIRHRVVDLRLGSVDALPNFDTPFDRILAVNANLFWHEPDARLRDLRQLLGPGGVIAVATSHGVQGRPTRRRRPTAGRSPQHLSERGSPRCGWRPCASSPRSCACSG